MLVRNALFALVRALASYRYEEAAALLEAGDETWTATRLEAEMKDYYVDHGGIRTDAEARSPRRIDVDKGDADSETWRVTQGLADPEGHDDWALHVRIDLAASADAGRPVLTLDRIGL